MKPLAKPATKPAKDTRAEHERSIQRHAAGTSLGSLVTEATMQQRITAGTGGAGGSSPGPITIGPGVSVSPPPLK